MDTVIDSTTDHQEHQAPEEQHHPAEHHQTHDEHRAPPSRRAHTRLLPWHCDYWSIMYPILSSSASGGAPAPGPASHMRWSGVLGRNEMDPPPVRIGFNEPE